MSTAFLVDSLLHAQRAQNYSDNQLKSSLSEMLLSRGQAEQGPPEDQVCSDKCAKRGYKCDKCRDNRAESVDSIEEMDIEMDDDEEDEDEDEIVADINSIETTQHLDDDDLEDELDLAPRREAIKLPKVEPKDTTSPVTGGTGTTILKDNNSKPILKFSVSAILGDTREGVRVRNGKAGERGRGLVRNKRGSAINLPCLMRNINNGECIMQNAKARNHIKNREYEIKTQSQYEKPKE